ncbi:fucolectin-2-like isoform X1 [Haliotis rufescens]|uniref:fucolectin-2-like isoform X1 n=2 Tax=Haliotis rufescens TaxID=6454 RepID=UPI00201F7C7F|nr:fucolectin-2-like isoform X1 [Haliotis rufescens]
MANDVTGREDHAVSVRCARGFGGSTMTSKRYILIVLASICSRPIAAVTTNLALHKPTSASSNFHKFSDPSHVVDGSASGYSGSSVCYFSRGDDKQPWWQVDLLNVYEISKLKIINRSDPCTDCGEGLRDFTIKGYCEDPSVTASAVGALCYYHRDAVPVGAAREITCTTPLSVRFVRLATKHPYFTLCEVIVFGTGVPSTGACKANRSVTVTPAESEGSDHANLQGPTTICFGLKARNHRVQQSRLEVIAMSTLHCATGCAKRPLCVGINVKGRQCEVIVSQTASMLAEASPGWNYLRRIPC